MVGLRAVHWLLIAFCAAAAVGYVHGLVSATGVVRIDLYQYWGVGQVIRETDGAVRNPYLESHAFDRELARFAQQSDEPVVREAHTVRPELELQATPVAYTLFSYLPSSYVRTQYLYSLGQLALFAGALALLLRRTGIPSRPALLFGLLLVPMYIPLRAELRVANYNTLLLFGIALAFHWIHRIPVTATAGAGLADDDDDDQKEHPVSASRYAAAAIGLLGSLVLLKPTVVPIALGLLACCIARLGPAPMLRPLLWGGTAIAAVACWPMVRLGSAGIWLEWVEYFQTGNLAMLELPWAKGNRSTVLFLSTLTGAPLAAVTIALGAALASGYSIILRGAPAPVAAARKALCDPTLALSLGVVGLLALSPLAWQHYYVLLLAGAIPLLRVGAGPERVPLLAGTSLLLAAVVPIQLLLSPLASANEFLGRGLPHAIHLGLMLSWVPLWLANLSALTASLRSAR